MTTSEGLFVDCFFHLLSPIIRGILQVELCKKEVTSHLSSLRGVFPGLAFIVRIFLEIAMVPLQVVV